MKIGPVDWPLETNQAMKSEILKDKLNELVVYLETDPSKLPKIGVVCLHPNIKVTKNNMKMCLDCHKFIGKA